MPPFLSGCWRCGCNWGGDVSGEDEISVIMEGGTAFAAASVTLAVSIASAVQAGAILLLSVVVDAGTVEESADPADPATPAALDRRGPLVLPFESCSCPSVGS